MAEITRPSEITYWIDLDVVERERTPEYAMKLGILRAGKQSGL